MEVYFTIYVHHVVEWFLFNRRWSFCWKFGRDDALAAINLVYPIQVILNASAIGIGIGGAVALSYFSGRDETKSADRSLGSTITLLIVAGIVLSIVLFFATPTLLEILGASGTIYEYAYDYIFVILCGGLLPVLGNGLSPLIRNYGKPLLRRYV